jgi:hypothetical protein
VERPGFAPDDVPLGTPDEPLRVLLDADILEIFTTSGYGAFRIAPATDPAATVLVVHDGADQAVVRTVTEPAPRLQHTDEPVNGAESSAALVSSSGSEAPVP